jgi:CheY-like chemotaxis protein
MNDDKKTVLIIEDEVEILEFASRLLELENFAVIKATNGKEGLELVRERKVDVILVDLRMPELDGWSVLETLNRDALLSSIPRLVFSAAADIPTRERALGLGAREYLVKPLSAQELKDAVNRVL